MKRDEIISIIKDYFTDKPVKSVYLFGSFARGEKYYNDVDVLVDFERGITLIDHAKFINDLAELIGEKVDIVPHSGLSSRIKPYVDAEKILIHER
ncbi:hypothetical protein AEM51_08370 [Bacteroidetes bacterium UKL13-3]|jgi:predicted nucleotidyltransferase|nr:hypothetical protein AEM51_08370 [Bacteroidetes bacterium UKL13-3]